MFAYQNAENGFCVIRVKARSHRDLVTVVGHAATISAGEWITASGDWVNDRTHGQQFRARFLKTSEPTSIEGIEKYLASGMIAGASALPTPRSSCAPSEKSRRHRDAADRLSGSQWHLARDIRGIGFKTADAIAMKLGVEKTAMIRVRAGISYALTEAMDEGHCGLPTAELLPLAEKLLEVHHGLIRTALELEIADGTVVADSLGETDGVFLTSLHNAERSIADQLFTLAKRMLPWPSIDADKAIPG